MEELALYFALTAQCMIKIPSILRCSINTQYLLLLTYLM